MTLLRPLIFRNVSTGLSLWRVLPGGALGSFMGDEKAHSFLLRAA